MDYSYYFVPNPTPEQVRQTYEFLSGISLLFHYKLRKIRDRAKLSLDEMARVVGAESGEEIESYEEANSRPSFLIANRYAVVTGIPLVLMVDDDIDTGDFRKF